jgi:hypothetical protein
MTPLDLAGLVIGLVGAPGGIVWFYDFYRRRLRGRAFWKIFGACREERLLLVIPSGGKCFDVDDPEKNYIPPNPNLITTVEDSMAKGLILEGMLRNGIIIDIALHTDISSTARAGNLFLICGPVGNQVSRALLSRRDLNLPFKFKRDGTWKIVDSQGSVVHPDVDSIKSDYAIAAKLENPWAPSDRPAKIFLAAGIEGLGTWGAASLLIREPDMMVRYLTGPAKASASADFCTVLLVSREGQGVIHVEVTHFRALPSAR